MKFLLKICILLILIVSIAFGYLWIKRVELAEYYLSKNLKAQVQLRDISLGLNFLAIDDLTIVSEKYKATLTAKQIGVSFTWSGLTSHPLTIEKVTVNNSELISDLADNPFLKIPKTLLQKGADLLSYNDGLPPPGKIDHKSEDKQILIKQIVINNLNVLIKNFWKDQKINIKHLVLRNIKSDPTTQDLAELIFQGIFAQLGQ